jgi:hypothetical protein
MHHGHVPSALILVRYYHAQKQDPGQKWQLAGRLLTLLSLDNFYFTLCSGYSGHYAFLKLSARNKHALFFSAGKTFPAKAIVNYYIAYFPGSGFWRLSSSNQTFGG